MTAEVPKNVPKTESFSFSTEITETVIPMEFPRFGQIKILKLVLAVFFGRQFSRISKLKQNVPLWQISRNFKKALLTGTTKYGSSLLKLDAKTALTILMRCSIRNIILKECLNHMKSNLVTNFPVEMALNAFALFTIVSFY